MVKLHDKVKAFRSRLIDYMIEMAMEGLDKADDATRKRARAAYAEKFNGYTLKKYPATQSETLEDGTEVLHIKFEMVKPPEAL